DGRGDNPHRPRAAVVRPVAEREPDGERAWVEVSAHDATAGWGRSGCGPRLWKPRPDAARAGARSGSRSLGGRPPPAIAQDVGGGGADHHNGPGDLPHAAPLP